MRVDADKGTVTDGDDVYEFWANTDMHFDVSLRGELVVELGYLPGILLPDVARSKLDRDLALRLAKIWGQHLRDRGSLI